MNRGTPMKRGGFKRPELPAKVPRDEKPLQAVVLAGRVKMAQGLGQAAPVTVRKPEPFRSEAWLAAVRTIPCVFCGAPVQAAHRNEGKGMGTKADDCLTAALCPPDHAEIDQGRDMTRDERRARMDRAIVLTLAELVRRGLVGVVPPP